MQRARHTILDWAGQGAGFPEGLARAMQASGALPGAEAWRRFASLFLLLLGTLLFTAGVLFFLAFNWDALGRYARFALVEALVVAALLPVAWFGLERVAGRAALFAAAVMLGGLLALVGQTYQTGADTYELFASWAAFILPWVLVSRFVPLWMLWLLLVNVALALYYETFGGMLGVLFGPDRLLWLLLAVDTLALALWDGLGWRGTGWLRPRWAPRVIATACGALVTTLALFAVLDEDRATRLAEIAVWLGWLGAAYLVYRRVILDLYVLAGGVLSVIVVVTAFLVRALAKNGFTDAAWLFTGLAVIGMSAAGSWWLRRVAAQARLEREQVA